MLCLDHRRAKTLAVQKHLLTALCPIKRQANYCYCFASIKRSAKTTLIIVPNRAWCQVGTIG
jgi:hypothetical protein